MLRVVTLFCLLVLPLLGLSQAKFFFPALDQTSAALDKQFEAYQLFEADPDALRRELQKDSISTELHLRIGAWPIWNLQMEAHDLRAPDFQLVVQGPNGRSTLERSENKTYRGAQSGNPDAAARMTVDRNFLYGLVEKGEEVYYFEPAEYLDSTIRSGIYVAYKASDVKQQSHTCGTNDAHQHGPKPAPEAGRMMMQCYGVEMGLAADYSLFSQYGSVTATENFMLGVLNNVQTNYDNEFNNEIEFQVQGFFISTCPSCDPWTSSNNAGALLNSFANWGNGGGFGFNHSLATLWTNRNLSGSTIGIAYVGGFCTSNRYNVCQRFTLNAEQLRVLQSHEIGHNFSATHDAPNSNFIMAPSVNTSNQWSLASQNAINGNINASANNPFCFSACGGGGPGGPGVLPPEAAIGAPVTEACPGSVLQFIDESTNDPVSWEWTFQGGVPSTSTAQNPVVQYPNPGNYVVSLTVENSAGIDVAVLNQDIQINQSNTKYLLHETFESGLGNWTVLNPDNDNGWEVTSVDGNPYGDRAAFMENFNYNADGEEDALVSPLLDLSQESGARLFIDYAYARYGPTNSDQMRVLVSTDGGNSYTDEIFIGLEGGGGSFATAADQSSEFTPNTPSDWCFSGSFGADCIALDLSDYFGEPQVRFKIENICDIGNNLYLDQVWVTSDCITVEPPVADFTADEQSGCAGFEVEFIDLSIGQIDTWSWSFPGGLPSQSNEKDPVVEYSSPGVYPVTLTVTNMSGEDTKTDTSFITVKEAPEAEFSSQMDKLTVALENQTEDFDSLSWDLGDSTVTTETDPVHTYAEGGDYAITLIAENACGQDTIVDTVTAVSPIEAGFSADTLQGCPGLEVMLSDTSTGAIASWNWKLEGASPDTSSLQNPTATYQQSGLFDLQLIVTDSSGFKDTLLKADYIQIDTLPEAAFSYEIDSSGALVQFTDESLRADSLLWDFGDGNSSTEADPEHGYTADGTYRVQLIAFGACGVDTASQDIEIITPPTADFEADILSGCGPILVQMVNYSSANSTAFEWNIEGAMPDTSTASDPIFSFPTAGVYDITLIATNATGADTLSKSVTISGLPVSAFELENELGSLQVATTNNSVRAWTFEWDFGDSTSSTEVAPTHTYPADSVYTVTLIANNNCGSDTAMQDIAIVTPPTAGFSVEPDAGCVAFTVMPQDTSSDNVTSWQWSAPGAQPDSSAAQFPTFVYDSVGNYTIVLEVANAADTVSVSQNVSVSSKPEAEFTANSSLGDATVQVSNTSQNATQYDWDFGDGSTSTEEAPVHTYTEDGTYTITLIASNFCGSDTSTQVVDITTAPIAAIEADTAFGCTPFALQLSDASENTIDNWNWQAPGSEEGSSSLQNPVFTYTSAGAYEVTLIVSNAVGADTASLAIEVGELPVASFTVSDTLGSLTVSLDNTSAGATEFFWSFGDGSTSTASAPVYTYGADGTYEIQLVAFNACGSDTAQQTVELLSAPSPGFALKPASGCAPLNVQIENQASANTESWVYRAQGASPPIATGPDPTFVFSAPGTYAIVQEVSNAAGTTADTLQLIVDEPPRAAFSASVATGSTVVALENESEAAESYFWDFGDGSISTDSLPAHAYNADGTYTITLVVENSCGNDTSQAEVSVVTPPTAGFQLNIAQGCAPLAVQVANEASPNATGWSWSAPGASPETATGQEPVFVYSTPGTYTLVQEVSNAAGTDQDTQAVVVDGLPTAAFDAAVDLGSTALQLQNQSDGATQYFWAFGDGESSTDSLPNHNYAADGGYTIRLVASNACGSDTAEAEVSVATPPTAGFALDQLQGCAPLTVQVEDQASSNTASWSWSADGADQDTASTAAPSFTFHAPGTYTIVQSVSNAAGNRSDSLQVVVEGLPQAGFVYEAVGSVFDFDNTSLNADSFRWDIAGLDTLYEEAPVYDFNGAGDYPVELTAYNGCGEDSFSDTLTVLPKPPEAGFSAAVTSGCAPFELTFEDNSTNADTYAWNFPGGTPAVSSQPSPTVVYDSAGTYTVRLTVYNAVDSSTQVKANYITVKGRPDAGFGYDIEEATVAFSNLSQGAESLSWSFGDGNGSTEDNPVHTYSEEGVFEVRLIATNNCGQDSSQKMIAISGEAPQAQLSVDKEVGCAPLSVQFSGSTAGSTAAEWAWSFPGGNPGSSTEQHPVVTYDTPGAYSASLAVANAFGEDTIELDTAVQVLAAPAPAFDYVVEGAEVRFTNLSDGGDLSYLWSFGDGATSAEENPTHVYASNGTYTITLAAANECDTVATSRELELSINAVAEEAWVEQLSIYPNPNNGQFWLELDASPSPELEIRLLNAVGQQTFFRSVPFGTGLYREKLSVGDLPNGLYLLELRANNRRIYRRLVIN